MAIGDILAAIRHETEGEIAKIAADAEQRVAAVLERAQREAAEVEERETHVRDAAARHEADRIVNDARLNADRRLRRAREDLYQQARRAAVERLADVRSAPDYPVVLDRFLDETRAVLSAGTVVRVDPADAPVIAAIVERCGGDGLQIRTDLETRGGLELWADDGRRVTNTLEARMEKAEPVLRSLAGERIPELRSAPS